MLHLVVVILWFCLLVLSGAHGGEGEWSRFRGPNGSGISNATTVPVRWTDKDYNWKVELPGVGHSSPVIWGKRVFATGGDPRTARRIVMCLDTADGHTLWQREYPSRTHPQHGDNGYATATPAVDAAGLVLTWTTPEQVLVLALDLDGREVWRRDLGPFITLQGSGGSPILFGGMVVLANEQEDRNLIPGRKTDPPAPIGKSFLIALDRKTGQTRWQIERRTTFSAYSTPCVYQAEGGRPELIFSNTAHGITAVDPVRGKVNWEFGEPFLDRAISSPVVAPGLVIAGHGAGLRASRYIAVRPGEQGRGPALAYEVTRAIPLVPTPLVKDGRLFFWTDDGVASCLHWADGKIVWQERVGGAYFGSPVWVDNRLYCISKSGEVVVVAASDKFEILSRVPLGEPSYATPAVADGVMYLRTRSHLFSLGGPGKIRTADR
jgi:outer membrane protein assembly factor BamB